MIEYHFTNKYIGQKSDVGIQPKVVYEWTTFLQLKLLYMGSSAVGVHEEKNLQKIKYIHSSTFQSVLLTK